MSRGMCFDYISKPIDPDELENKILYWLDKDKVLKEGVMSDQYVNKEDIPELPIWDKASALKRLGGNQKRLDKLVSLFLSSIPALAEGLAQAITDGENDKVMEHVHTIKGVSANLGALQLQQVSSCLELAVKDGDTDKLHEIHVQFIECFDSFCQLIEKDLT